jgi:hypothetical protein
MDRVKRFSAYSDLKRKIFYFILTLPFLFWRLDVTILIHFFGRITEEVSSFDQPTEDEACVFSILSCYFWERKGMETDFVITWMKNKQGVI